MHIEIITTRNEALKESGFGSLKACNSVFRAVERLGYDVKLSVCEDTSCLEEVVKRKPDLVILAVKYIPRENEADIWLSEYFSRHNVNFTGSLREVLKFDSNKVKAKMHLTNKGINTARYFIAIPDQYRDESELPLSFPLFLKPLDAANGNGIDDLSFVTSFGEFVNKTASLYESFGQPVLVEEYLDGREFTVAVIKKHNDELVLSAVEIIPLESTNGLRILGAQAKKDDSEKMTPIEDGEIKNRVSVLAANVFNHLGVRDFGRVDIKMNTNGDCFFMEVNLVPGMTFGSSYFPQACHLAHGFDYDEVVELLLSGGIARASSAIPPNLHSDPDKHIVAV